MFCCSRRQCPLGTCLRQKFRFSRSRLPGFRPMVLEAVLDIFTLPQDLKTGEGAEDLDNLDPEDTSFQASFSKLGASESTVRDPVANVPDAKLFLSKQLAEASKRNPGKVGNMILRFMISADRHFASSLR